MTRFLDKEVDLLSENEKSGVRAGSEGAVEGVQGRAEAGRESAHQCEQV
ncbi:hypothetical protein [Nocardia nova]